MCDAKSPLCDSDVLKAVTHWCRVVIKRKGRASEAGEGLWGT